MTQEHIHPLEDKIQLIRKRNNEQEDFSCAYSSYMKEHWYVVRNFSHTNYQKTTNYQKKKERRLFLKNKY